MKEKNSLKRFLESPEMARRKEKKKKEIPNPSTDSILHAAHQLSQFLVNLSRLETLKSTDWSTVSNQTLKNIFDDWNNFKTVIQNSLNQVRRNRDVNNSSFSNEHDQVKKDIELLNKAKEEIIAKMRELFTILVQFQNDQLNIIEKNAGENQIKIRELNELLDFFDDDDRKAITSMHLSQTQKLLKTLQAPGLEPLDNDFFINRNASLLYFCDRAEKLKTLYTLFAKYSKENVFNISAFDSILNDYNNLLNSLSASNYDEEPLINIINMSNILEYEFIPFVCEAVESLKHRLLQESEDERESVLDLIDDLQKVEEYCLNEIISIEITAITNDEKPPHQNSMRI